MGRDGIPVDFAREISNAQGPRPVPTGAAVEQVRRVFWKSQPQPAGHVQGVELRLGRSKRPRFMMDLPAPDPSPSIRREEAIPLRQPGFQRTRFGSLWDAGRRVGDVQPGLAAAAMGASASVAGGFRPGVGPGLDVRVEIRQVIGQSSDPDSETRGGIQAEEPDPGQAPDPDIGPDVQLRECVGARNRRKPPWVDPAHPERHDPDPRDPVAEVDLEGRIGRGEESLQDTRIDRPVGEQQIVPVHRQHPASGMSERGFAGADHGGEVPPSMEIASPAPGSGVRNCFGE